VGTAKAQSWCRTVLCSDTWYQQPQQSEAVGEDLCFWWCQRTERLEMWGWLVCNMGDSESAGWHVASEARHWKSNLGPMGMAPVESSKRCPEGWKRGSSALPVRNWEPRQGRRWKGCSENWKNLLTPAGDSHYSHWFKTGHCLLWFQGRDGQTA